MSSTGKGREDELAASKAAALEAYEKLLEARHHFRLAAESAGMDLKEDAATQLLRGRDRAEELGEQANAYVRDRPLAALGVAFAAGFVMAQLLSRR